jgi:hypothetical protein
VGGVIATPNVMCRWVDRSAAEEVRTVPNGKCFHEVGDRLFPTYGNTSENSPYKELFDFSKKFSLNSVWHV